MKDRPILYCGSMVRALLNDSKTQTRRVVKLPARHYFAVTPDYPGQILVDGNDLSHGNEFPVDELRCPYGQPGDRLWVRESIGYDPEYGHQWADGKFLCEVFGDAYSEDDMLPDRGIPSIHVPRRYSRITLEIVSVRVERLQDISRGDAMAEGCPFPNMAQGDDPRQWYADLWEQINGPGTWDANPWVWVIEFKRVKS